MRRHVLAGVAVGLGLFALADALAARAGLVAGAVPRSDGPWLWVASRGAGVAAFVALFLDVTFGLFLSTGAADRWIARARSVEIHRWLSSATLALLAGHALLLLGDGFSGFDLLDAVVPFLVSYRPAPVALGLFAAYLAVVVQVSFALRSRIGVQSWRRLHRSSFAVFALATLHGLFAGSDSGAPWLRLLYLGAAATVSALLLQRLALSWRAARPSRAR